MDLIQRGYGKMDQQSYTDSNTEDFDYEEEDSTDYCSDKVVPILVEHVHNLYRELRWTNVGIILVTIGLLFVLLIK